MLARSGRWLRIYCKSTAVIIKVWPTVRGITARARSGGQVTPEQSVRGNRLLRGTVYSVTGQ